MSQFQSRQGDILIEEISVLPEGLKRKEDPVLVWGEATGHCHTLEATNFDDVDLYVDPEGNILIETKTDQKVDIAHNKHGAVTLPNPGRYRVSRQREFDAAEAEKERLMRD